MGKDKLRQFSMLTLPRSVRDVEGDLPPTPADPSIPEGRLLWITFPNGRTILRICRGGYWVTAEPAV